MKRLARIALLALLLVALALGAGASPSLAQSAAVAGDDGPSLPPRLELGALMAWVDASPRARVEAALAEAYRGDVTAAGAHPNPTITYDGAGFLGGIETNGGSQHQLLWTQPLLWPGQRDARIGAALAELELARARTGALRAALGLELWQAALRVAAARERASLLAEARRELERVGAIVQGRAEAGAARRWDATRVEVELEALRSSERVASAEEDLETARLAALLGAPPRRFAEVPSLADLAASVERRSAPSGAHPRLVAAQRAIDAARARVDRERALAMPPIELGVGTVLSTAPEGGYLVGHVSLPLPLFDANQGAIERAERERTARELELDAHERELRARADGAARALATLEAARASFEERAGPRLVEIGRLAETALQGGEVSAFELLDVVRSARAVREQRLELELSVRLAELELVAAVEGHLSPRR